MWRRLAVRMVAVLAFGAIGPALALPAKAAKLTVLPDLTAPYGSGGVITDTMLANVLARHNVPVSLAAQETPGYVYNLRYMNRTYDTAATKMMVFGVDGWLFGVGPHGGTGVIKDSFPRPVTHHFKLLFEHVAGAVGRFFVTFDPKIKTAEDIKGHTLDIGLLSQSDWGLSANMVLEAYGITPANTKIRYVSPPVMTTQLINGTVDVALTLFLGNPVNNKFVPASQLVKLFAAAKGSGKTLHFISVSPEILAEVNKKYDTLFYPVVIKAHSLDPDQDETFTAGVARAYHAVEVGFPPDIAYQLTKAVLTYGPELKKEGAGWTYWSANAMVSGLTTCNTNRGAIKAYKEAHVWQLRKTAGPRAIVPPCTAKG